MLTILYGIAEGVISLALGAESVSVSLLAFGADSWVEVVSACMVCWRFYSELSTLSSPLTARIATAKERLATLVLGLLLCLLALAVIGGSTGALATYETPETGVVNILIGAISVAFMSVLYICKTRVALALPSSTVEADAQCALFCAQLSAVLLVGAVVFRAAPSVWWFDSATALVIALMIGKEGVETVRASRKKDFTGAGCGCEGGDGGGMVMRWMRKRLKEQSAVLETPGGCQGGGCGDGCGDDGETTSNACATECGSAGTGCEKAECSASGDCASQCRGSKQAAIESYSDLE